MTPERFDRKARKLEKAYGRVLATSKEYRSALKSLMRLVPDDPGLEGMWSQLQFDRASHKRDRRRLRMTPEAEPVEADAAPAQAGQDTAGAEARRGGRKTQPKRVRPSAAIQLPPEAMPTTPPDGGGAGDRA